ncbi:MAG: TetR/AcrR family transcriptional regulator [Pseudomonadales bacterium]
MAKRPDSRTRVLDAAAAIVARAGAAHLTMDAVAAEAGLSKGGLLYHYPSKNALLQGMLGRLLHEVGSRAARLRDDETRTDLEAWVLAERDQTDRERATALALLAGSAEDPSLLDPARDMVADVFRRVADEAADADLARIVLLGVEGLRFLDMLNLLTLNDADRQRLYQRMLALAAQ